MAYMGYAGTCQWYSNDVDDTLNYIVCCGGTNDAGLIKQMLCHGCPLDCACE